MIFDATALHAYWSTAGLTQWNALRWRLYPRPSGLILVTEAGRDKVRDGNPAVDEGWLPKKDGSDFGWMAQGVSDLAYVAELHAYDAQLRADGVYGVVFTTSPDDEWSRKGFDADGLADRLHGCTNLGPHDLEGRSPQALAWAAVAPIVKSVDQTAAIRRARPDAITVYRRRWTPAEQDDILERQDTARVVGAIVEGLAGFRHPRLHVELLNEVGKGRREQYLRLCRVVVPQLRAIGLKVAGPSWATGDYELEDWTAFVGAAPPPPPPPPPQEPTVPDIALTVPTRVALASPENYQKGPRAKTIGVVIHTTRGGGRPENEFSSTLAWFTNPDAQVSAHLVVGHSPFDEVARCVHDDDVAWHARAANATHLSIEICQAKATDPITPFQYEAAAQACYLWSRKYGFPIKRVWTITQPGIVGHEDTEPGKLDKKTDPGPVFDWVRFIKLAGGASVPPTPTPTKVDVAKERDALWAIAERLETGGYAWMGQAIKAVVALSKGER